MPLPDDVLMGAPGRSTRTDPAGSGSRGRTPERGRWIALLALFLLAAIALVAVYYRVSQRVCQVVTRMGRLERGLEKATVELNRSAEELRQANRRAEDAENRAQLASRRESEAEAARQIALRDARRAEAESEEARLRTLLAEEQAARAQQEAEAFQRAKEEELNRLQESLNRISDTRRTALGVVMNLSSDALKFEFDRSELSGASRELLSRIAGILLTLPRNFGVYVYGHTDDVGSEAYNQSLSERRAESVRDYLVSAGIDPEQITTEGFGKSRPLVKSTTTQARAQNRRVEIGIINTEIRYHEALKNGPIKDD